jgi:hypothetical protein
MFCLYAKSYILSSNCYSVIVMVPKVEEQRRGVTLFLFPIVH